MSGSDTPTYTPDQQRVADWIVKHSQETLGGGDDPIGFLVTSYEYVMAKLTALREVARLARECDKPSDLA